MFSETIRANISYGRGRDASETDIIYSIELSNAHGFISGLQQASLTTPDWICIPGFHIRTKLKDVFTVAGL